MAKIDLTMKNRVYIKAHLNPQPIANRSEGRKLDRLWVALRLDDFGDEVKVSDLKPEPETFEMSSDDRDHLIAYLDKQMTGAMSRQLGPIYDTLIRSRDGAQAAPALASVPETA